MTHKPGIQFRKEKGYRRTFVLWQPVDDSIETSHSNFCGKIVAIFCIFRSSKFSLCTDAACAE